jgi:hypothetical protein
MAVGYRDGFSMRREFLEVFVSCEDVIWADEAESAAKLNELDPGEGSHYAVILLRRLSASHFEIIKFVV